MRDELSNKKEDFNREDFNFIKFLPEDTYGTEEGVEDYYGKSVEDYMDSLAVHYGIPIDKLLGQEVGLRDPIENDGSVRDLLGQTVTVKLTGVITTIDWFRDGGTATITLQDRGEIKVSLDKLKEVMET